jgi:hypothetical protein
MAGVFEGEKPIPLRGVGGEVAFVLPLPPEVQKVTL